MNSTSHDMNSSACRCTVAFGTRPVMVVACPEISTRKYVREKPTRTVNSITMAMPVQNLRSRAAGETSERAEAAVAMAVNDISTGRGRQHVGARSERKFQRDTPFHPRFTLGKMANGCRRRCTIKCHAHLLKQPIEKSFDYKCFRRSLQALRTHYERYGSHQTSFDTSSGGPSHFMPCASAIFASTGCLLERVKKSSIWPAGVNPISIRPGFSPT